MELGKDLKQILKDFSALSACHKSTTDQIDSLKKTLEEKEKELAEVHANTAVQRKENQERQKLVDIIESLVAAIPDYKKKIGELEECEKAGEARLKEKTEELVEMKRKHRQHMAGLEEKMAKDYTEEKEQERIRMELLAESLRSSHEEELARLTKVAEKERQELEEHNRRLLDEREKMRVEQLEEEEMLRVQIAVAKKSNNQNRPSNVDIYKRKVDSVKQHYEDQLKEMTAELAALKQEESNFYLDIATSFGTGVSPAERDSKPKILVTEENCSINMSDFANSGGPRSVAFQNTPSSFKTSGRTTANSLSGLFQQAEKLSSEVPTLDQSSMEATSGSATPAALRNGATASIFKFKKLTPTLKDAAAKGNTTNQNAGFELVGDHQKQQPFGRATSQAVGVGTGAKVGSSGISPLSLSGSKRGKPSFKFVSKASSAGGKGASRFLPVVAMGPEDENDGGAEHMGTHGRKRSLLEREFGGLEQ